jgi:hypothetical protein
MNEILNKYKKIKMNIGGGSGSAGGEDIINIRNRQRNNNS